ncbi:sodium-coupled neutral amino acid transporter 7-like [Bacillus rossius redtenbacheri]|uniref:sodium-coupled neutral amino acid transporter 7-like n=1 Tax=Bacillus rossius redtenbacheri TaxID=93214 RepID=UPI002FDD5598
MEFILEEDSVINDDLILSNSLSISINEEQAGGSSRLSVIFLIINAALGAGLLNFPQAFDQAGGVLTALSVQAVLLAWIMGSLIILAYCADQASARTLQDVLEWSCGRTGLWVGSVCITVYCLGTCVTFLVIIGDQFDRVLSSQHGSDFCYYWYMNRGFTITASSTLLILPLCYSRRIDFLKYASSLGVVEVLCVVALIVYEKYYGGFVPGPVKSAPDHWTDMFLVIPVICFGYQCHVSVIPIYACLKGRSLRNFTLCTSCAIGLCAVVYTLAGAFGYLTFGSLVTSDILESYDKSSPLVLMGVVSIAVKTITTYPILLFCGREAVSQLWCSFFHTLSADVALQERSRRVVITSACFALTLALAVVSPDIGSVIDMLGSLAAVFIFVFPGVCLLLSTLRKDPHILLNKDKFMVVVSAFLILFGTFIFGLVFVQAAERFASQTKHVNELCFRA